MPDWDAARYHRLSQPQAGWGRKVLDRLHPQPDERILDIGCGTGRLTSEIATQPGIFVIGVDYSRAMLEQAREYHPVRSRQQGPAEAEHVGPTGEGLPASAVSCTARVAFVRGNGAMLPFGHDVFDAVFSGATFHWIANHDDLFHGIHRVLKPGGRLVAQCGGGPNLRVLLDRTHRLMDSTRYAAYFTGWSDPWLFAGIENTRCRLERAGFESIDVSLEEAPTTLESSEAYEDFIACVCVRHHVDRLPAVKRAEFVSALAQLASADDPPFTLDYWRLNISARKVAR